MELLDKRGDRLAKLKTKQEVVKMPEKKYDMVLELDTIKRKAQGLAYAIEVFQNHYLNRVGKHDKRTGTDKKGNRTAK